jgi:hypothetical protein
VSDVHAARPSEKLVPYHITAQRHNSGDDDLKLNNKQQADEVVKKARTWKAITANLEENANF